MSVSKYVSSRLTHCQIAKVSSCHACHGAWTSESKGVRKSEITMSDWKVLPLCQDKRKSMISGYFPFGKPACSQGHCDCMGDVLTGRMFRTAGRLVQALQ